MKKNNLLTIQEFAVLCHSTPRTLRLYEKLGILLPVTRDAQNHYRLYDRRQGRLFYRIKLLQSFHIPLKKIPELLSQEDNGVFLDQQIDKLREKIKEKEKEYEFLKHMRKFFFEEQDLLKIVRKEIVGPFEMVGQEVTKEHYHKLDPDMVQLSRKVDSFGLKRTPLTMVLYHDPVNYKPLNTRIDISVILKEKPEKDIPIPEGFFVKTFPKTTAYVYDYRGPHDFITLVYEKLHELHITKKLPVIYRPFDIQMEDFLTPHSEYDLVTKICFPIAQ